MYFDTSMLYYNAWTWANVWPHSFHGQWSSTALGDVDDDRIADTSLATADPMFSTTPLQGSRVQGPRVEDLAVHRIPFHAANSLADFGSNESWQAEHSPNAVSVHDHSDDKGEEEDNIGTEDDAPMLDSPSAVDIESEILQAATDGMSVIQREGLQILSDLLGCVRHFFLEDIMCSEREGCPLEGDDLVELRSASCFKHVDRLLRLSVPQWPAATTDDLSQLRNHLQDLVVLSCCRGLDQKELHGRGLPQQLRVRLEAALGANALTNLKWLSLFGNSKQHIFMTGISWGYRRSRNKQKRLASKAEKLRREAMMMQNKPCIFFHVAGGCKLAKDCPYPHVPRHVSDGGGHPRCRESWGPGVEGSSAPASGSHEIALGAETDVTLDGEVAPDAATVPIPMINGVKLFL